nr:D-glycero-beta-D-manno-heptose 1,7-bisphosphate 7-phosphatase [Stenotrophomonas pavanii]
MSRLPQGPGLVEGDGVAGAAERKVLFLDRDGVINVNHGYVHTPEQTQWVPGIFELCTMAKGRGYALVIATNQAGIARGYYDIQTFEAYTRWMHAQFAQRGIAIAATVFCPHHPEAGEGPFTTVCNCRKPAPGMFLEAARRYPIDLPQSALVGDKISDMQAGHAAEVGRLFLLAGDVGKGDAPHNAVVVDALGEVQARL